MGSPQKVKDPRNDAASTLSGFIQAALGNAPKGMANFGPGQLGSIIQNMFQMPAYQGQLGTGVTDQQANIANMLNDQFFGDMQADSQARMNVPSAMLMQNAQNSNAPVDYLQNQLANVGGQNVLQAQSLGNTGVQQQLQALGMLPAQFFGQAANMLQGGNQPAINGLLQNGSAGNPAIMQLLGASNQSNPFISQLAGAGGSNPFIQQLAGAGQQAVNTPERQLLLAAAGGNPLAGAQQQIGGAQGNLQSLFSNQGIQNLLNGGGIDLAKVAAPLEAARKQALASDQNDIREQFTTAGLRNSSNLADAMGKQALQSETGLQAQLSQLVPQIMGQQQQGQLGALNALAGIGGTQGQLGTALGQLGLGRQSNVLQGLGQAGQLGISGAQVGSNALGQAGQLQLGQNQLGSQNLGQAGSLLNQLFGINNQAALGAGGLSNDLLNAQNQALMGAGNLNTQAAQALAQMGLQQQGQQANILQGLLGSQFNAASQLGSQSMQGNQLLASLLQSGQQNQLQSLLGAQSANVQNAQLPYQLGNLAAQQTNINQQTAQQQNLLQYQDFLRQQQLFPQLLSFLGGTTPTQLGPSAFQQAMGGLGTAAAFASFFL